MSRFDSNSSVGHGGDVHSRILDPISAMLLAFRTAKNPILPYIYGADACGSGFDCRLYEKALENIVFVVPDILYLCNRKEIGCLVLRGSLRLTAKGYYINVINLVSLIIRVARLIIRLDMLPHIFNQPVYLRQDKIFSAYVGVTVCKLPKGVVARRHHICVDNAYEGLNDLRRAYWTGLDWTVNKRPRPRWGFS
jgi:hypothetical protein